MMATVSVVALLLVAGCSNSSDGPEASSATGSGASTGGGTTSGGTTTGGGTTPGGGTTGGFDSFGPSSSITIAGPSLTVDFTESASGDIAVSPFAPGVATVAITTDANDEIDSIVASGDAAPLNLNASNVTDSFEGVDSTGLSAGQVILFAEQEDPTTGLDDQDLHVILSTGPNDADQFDYQVFGDWGTEAPAAGGGRAGQRTFASIGFETPAGSVPTSGEASYAGAANGVILTAAGEPQSFAADMAATVRFGGTPGFDFATTNTRVQLGDEDSDPIVTDASRNITGSGTLSGARLTGTVASTGLSGTLDGRLYGPAAEEIGGTLLLQGAGGTMAGAFGGKSGN